MLVDKRCDRPINSDFVAERIVHASSRGGCERPAFAQRPRRDVRTENVRLVACLVTGETSAHIRNGCIESRALYRYRSVFNEIEKSATGEKRLGLSR
jgi:hypothetical protein